MEQKTAKLISYPKKKTDQKKVYTPKGIPEPIRQSLYDVILHNLRAANRCTYIHRLIYVGEHFYDKDGLDALPSIFEDIIKYVNETTNLEKLTGFFLFYTKYFLHVVEGDEDSLNKHLKLLFESEACQEKFGVMKLVIHLNHVGKRLTDKWYNYQGQPPTLLGELNKNCSFEEAGRHLCNCIKKVYTLIYEFIDYVGKRISNNSDDEKKSVVPSFVSLTRSELRSSDVSVKISMQHLRDPFRPFMPEFRVLEFILNTSFTIPLIDYYRMYGVIYQIRNVKDRIWPVPADFIPFDVFEGLYDCEVELPRESEKKTGKADVLDDLMQDEDEENAEESALTAA